MNIRKHLLLLITMLLLNSCSPRVLTTDTAIAHQTQTSPTAIPTSSNPNEYIGLKFPPLPTSIKTSMGHAISPSSSQFWSIDAVADSNNYMLWFSKVISRDQNGKPYWQVSDIAVLPSTAKDKNIIVSACLLDGLLDPEMVVLANVDEESLAKRYLTNSNVILAWKANRSTGKLEPIDTKGIECYAETVLGYQ